MKLSTNKTAQNISTKLKNSYQLFVLKFKGITPAHRGGEPDASMFDGKGVVHKPAPPQHEIINNHTEAHAFNPNGSKMF